LRNELKNIKSEVDSVGGKYTTLSERAQCLERLFPEMKTENVTGNNNVEKYYDLNGRRYYLVIDGKVIECYRGE